MRRNNLLTYPGSGMMLESTNQEADIMPANTTRHTLNRQWELLQMLPRRGSGASVSDLTAHLCAKGFTVSPRQTERDLKQLREAMPIECNDKSKPHGWKWVANSLPGLHGVMSMDEATSWKLMESQVQSLLPECLLANLRPFFIEAGKRLDHLALQNTAANWHNKVRTVPPAMPMLGPETPEAVRETVMLALLHEKQVDVRYRKPGMDNARALRLHPLGLIQRDRVDYLIATADDAGHVNHYALHRILEAGETGAKAIVPPDFNLDAFINDGRAQFGQGGQIRLEARIQPWLAHILGETPLSHDQQISIPDDGAHLLTAKVNDCWQLHWWILSLGAGLEVLAPEDLRRSIRKQLKQAFRQYRRE